MSKEEIKFNVIKHFGPSIFHAKIPNQVVERLNDYIEKIILNKEKQKKYNHGNNLVGDVTEELTLDRELIQKIGWLEFLTKCTSKWIEISTGKEIKRFDLIQTWIVRQFKNEYNPTHWHGGHISGAGFLKIPKNLGENTQKKNNVEYVGGKLQFIHGARMFLCNSKLSIKPEVGDFFFFPNYLMHQVFPFKDTNEERRSISFNAFIDEDIYNVYSN